MVEVSINHCKQAEIPYPNNPHVYDFFPICFLKCYLLIYLLLQMDHLYENSDFVEMYDHTKIEELK